MAPAEALGFLAEELGAHRTVATGLCDSCAEVNHRMVAEAGTSVPNDVGFRSSLKSPAISASIGQLSIR